CTIIHLFSGSGPCHYAVGPQAGCVGTQSFYLRFDACRAVYRTIFIQIGGARPRGRLSLSEKASPVAMGELLVRGFSDVESARHTRSSRKDTGLIWHAGGWRINA